MPLQIPLRWIAILSLAVATVLAPAGSSQANAAQSDPSSVTVMTFNVANGLVSPERLVAYLRRVDADIVALQEVTSETEVALNRDLDDIYPHREIRGLGIPGMALLSRFPIASVEWLELSQGRPDLIATLDLDGEPITVMNVHPQPPRLSRSGLETRPGATEQFEGILEIASGVEGPLVLLGDFNITPLHSGYAELEGLGLIDTFGAEGVGPGFTYPARLPAIGEVDWALGLLPVTPFIRIDYIWVSEHWQTESASVGKAIGSDHRPVVATVTLTNADHAANLQ